ncbi:TcpQ domain-containing protein [Ectopseudomonas toyotomiensis]|uniref:PFGI-1 class ICE element type IV pilus protein PilL2 n=1 Tax=Ectopseudomonas toyotomiensis TaxID=554344 RepID=UPI003D0E1CFC
MRHPLLLTMALVATTGCSVTRQPVLAEPEEVQANPAFVAPDIYANRSAAITGRERDQVRSGRYTLTSTLPSIAQEDLMSQIIEVTIPGTLKPTVGDALKHALSRSGYTLSGSNNVTNVLYSRPLPAAHYKLGPMKLRDTLQVLAGPAWKVQVDEVTRLVQFTLRPGYQVPNQSTASATFAVASKSATVAPVISSTSFPAVADTSALASATTPERQPVETAMDGTTSTGAGLPPAAQKQATTTAGSPATKVEAPQATSTAAPVVSPAPLPKPLSQVWVAEAGSTLRESVEGWGEKAGWKVIWAQEDLNYPIAATLRFEGSFMDAIDQLFPLYDDAPRPFVVDGSRPQKLVHIAERIKK